MARARSKNRAGTGVFPEAVAMDKPQTLPSNYTICPGYSAASIVAVDDQGDNSLYADPSRVYDEWLSG